jgi:mono/diheme cytochrome c family protein
MRAYGRETDMTGWTGRLAGVAAVWLAAGGALAEEAAGGEAASGESVLGEAVYSTHCAICHGAGGAGDGPIAELLTVEVPDLTSLQAANGGVFPVARVWDVIENGGGIGAHGAPDMPPWGERLLVDAYLASGIEVAPAAREAFVRARLLAVIDTIARMQAP